VKRPRFERVDVTQHNIVPIFFAGLVFIPLVLIGVLIGINFLRIVAG
jgi:hypothetical protein